MDRVLKHYGAGIESKPRYGFILLIEDTKKYEILLAGREQNSWESGIPDTTEERANFLLAYLLNQVGYIKLEALCEFLYVSKSTLTSALKQAEDVFEQYGFKLERRPNYGIRAVGREMDFRRCMAGLFIKRDSLKGMNDQHKEEELERLAEIILFYLQKYRISFSETAFENFISYIYVANKRITRGKTIEFAKESIQNLNESERFFRWSFCRKDDRIFLEPRNCDLV